MYMWFKSCVSLLAKIQIADWGIQGICRVFKLSQDWGRQSLWMEAMWWYERESRGGVCVCVCIRERAEVVCVCVCV